MRTNQMMKKILPIILIVTSLSLSAQDSVLLRLNYTQGDSYLVDTEIKTDMGRLGCMNMKVSWKKDVSEVSAEGVKLESKVVSIIVDMKQDGKITMNYDSSQKDEELDEMGQMLKSKFDPMMNAIFHTSLDNLGNVIETRTVPDIPGIEELLSNVNTVILPEEKVSVGTTWTSEVKKQGIIMSIKYTVSNIVNGNVTLDISGNAKGVESGSIKGKETIEIGDGISKNSMAEMTIVCEEMTIHITVNSLVTKI